jgi:hypothetical protein
VQEEFGSRLSDGYIGGMGEFRKSHGLTRAEQALEAVNDYKTFRKKLDSRRYVHVALLCSLNPD